MRYVSAKSTRHLTSKIRTFAPISGIVLLFGSTPVLARGGGHSGGQEVATPAGMVVTLVATEGIMELATRLDGLQAAQRQGAIS